MSIWMSSAPSGTFAAKDDDALHERPLDMAQLAVTK